MTRLGLEPRTYGSKEPSCGPSGRGALVRSRDSSDSASSGLVAAQHLTRRLGTVRLLGLHSPASTSGGYHGGMSVRLFRPEDAVEVTAMMRALWPTDDPYDFSDESNFVWQPDDRPGLGGFVSFSIRAWAEGCESTPVPYIEGWWVAPDLRGSGVGRALVLAVESWCLEHGHHELGSDVELDNEASLRAHAALGFEPTLRLQFFRKRLR